MNIHYNNRYLKFIASIKAIQREAIFGDENHHILPRSLGGGDNSDNLISLRPREHFIAHRFLHKIYGGKMSQALWIMCNAATKDQSRNYHFASRLYEEVRNRAAEQSRIRNSGSGNPMFGKPSPMRGKTGILHPNFGRVVGETEKQKLRDASQHRKLTEEEKLHLSETRKGSDNPFFGKTHTDEWKEKERISKSGANNHNFGKTWSMSEENKKKIADSVSKAPKEKVTCPHCDMVGGKPVMSRFHFDNCKKKAN